MCVWQFVFQLPYGVVNIDKQRIVDIDGNSESFFLNAGIYVLDHEVLTYIPSQTFFDVTPWRNRPYKQSGPDTKWV